MLKRSLLSVTRVRSFSVAMDPPHNRQYRPPSGDQRGRRGGRGGRGGRSGRGGRAPATLQQAYGTVPTIQQVLPGASVFIVLKEDQSTGNETAGIVQDILTRGNHPRGIKVRLRGGQVGRVQRMGSSSATTTTTTTTNNSETFTFGLSSGTGGEQRRNMSTGYTMRYTDVRNDGFAEGPPPRSLADFMPDFGEEEAVTVGKHEGVARCLICDEFEGDEAAVTYHIDKVHLA